MIFFLVEGAGLVLGSMNREHLSRFMLRLISRNHKMT